MKRDSLVRGAAALLAAFLALACPGAAQGQVSMEARAKFGGFYRPSGWVHFVITTVNAGAGFQGKISVRGSGGASFERSVFVPPMRQQHTIPVLVHSFAPGLAARLLGEDGSLVSETPLPQPRPLSAGDVLVGYTETGPQSTDLNPQLYLEHRGVLGAGLAASDLPVSPKDYDNFDAVILHGLEWSGVDGQKIGALLKWVENGGRIVVSAPALLFRDGPTPLMKALYPSFGDVPRPAGSELLAAWGRWSHETEALQILGAQPGDSFFIEEDALLFVRLARGRGNITILCMDPDSPESAAWSFEKKQMIWEKILLGSGAPGTGRRGTDCVVPAAFSAFAPGEWPAGTMEQSMLCACIYAGAALAVCAFLYLFIPGKTVFLAVAVAAGAAGAFGIQKAGENRGTAVLDASVTAEFENKEERCTMEKTVHVSALAEGPVGFTSRTQEPLYPLAYNLHLLKTTRMTCVPENNWTAVEGLRLRPGMRFCFRYSEEKTSLGRIAAGIEHDGTPRATVRSELVFALRDCVILRRGQAYMLGAIGPGDARVVKLAPGEGVGFGSLVASLDRRGMRKERRLIEMLMNEGRAANSMIFAGFADGIEKMRLSTDGFLESEEYPLLAYTVVKGPANQ